MNKLLAAVALPLLAVGCVTDVDPAQIPDDPQAVPTSDPSTAQSEQPQGTLVPGAVPKSCAEVAAHLPSGTDGEYVLFFQNQSELHWVAYCADLQSAPREYLTLPHTGNGKNTSMFAAGGAAQGTNVVTAYDKVRIDPASFAIDIGDQSFAHSTGTLTSGGTTVTAMPFGVAATCGGKATANLDLSGTPFHVEDGLPKRGDAAAVASLTVSADGRSLDVAIEGACGWMGPADLLGQPLNDDGGSALRLAYRL